MKNKTLRSILLSSLLSCPFFSFSQNAGIGTTTPSGKLHIKGSANVSQLIIDANSLQSDSNALIKLRNSIGEDLMWIHSNNAQNAFIGFNAGKINDTGVGVANTFMGSFAGAANTNGFANTATGNTSLWVNSDGSENAAYGFQSLYSNKAGSNATAIGSKTMLNSNNTTIPFTNYSVAIGYAALRGSDFPSLNTGNYNTAVGYTTLYTNSTGGNNTASGYSALYNNTTGSNNAATGNYALYNNTTGNYNAAFGVNALSSNTTGNYNTAFGLDALYNNVAGSNGTALGYGAMLFAHDSSIPFTNYNVAVGYEALRGSATASANTGNYNTALGDQTLWNNTSGDRNTASGMSALYTNTTGYSNVAYGNDALYFNSAGIYNTACGERALINVTTAVRNSALGRNAGSDFANGNWCTFAGAYANANSGGYSNSAALGDEATFTGTNYIRIGDSGVSTIGGAVGWSNLSDGRFKTDVKQDVKGLAFITLLRPITYHVDIDAYNRHTYGDGYDQSEMKRKYDEMKNSGLMQNEKTTFSGFIAQDVELSAKEAGYDFSGVVLPQNDKDAYSLRYSDFVVPLVKSVQELNEKVASLQSDNEKLVQRIEKLESLLQARN